MNKKVRLTILSVLSLLILLLVFILSVIPEDGSIHVHEKLLPPSSNHIFGTDFLGRDLFLRTIKGFRNTFGIALLSQLIPFFLGVCIGAYVGYYGNIVDEILFHVFNIFLSFPTILAAIFLSVYFGRGIHTVIVVFSIFGLIYNIKLIRAEIQSVKNADYVVALRLSGISERIILIKHMIPRGFFILLPLMPMLIGHTMIGVSSFAFLGLGLQAPTPELGIILKDGLRFANQAPWLIFIPGIFQFSSILIFTLFSDELETRLQERMLGGTHGTSF